MFTQIGLGNLWKQLLSEEREANPYFEIMQNDAQAHSMKILCVVDGMYRTFKRDLSKASNFVPAQEARWQLVAVEKALPERYWVLPSNQHAAATIPQVLSAA